MQHIFYIYLVEFQGKFAGNMRHLGENNYWKQHRGGVVFIGWCLVAFFGSILEESDGFSGFSPVEINKSMTYKSKSKALPHSCEELDI